MNPLDLAQRYFGEYVVKGDEIIPTYCPMCGGGSKRQKNTFALNVDKLTYNCKRANNCNSKGTFKQLCEHFGEEADLPEGYRIQRRPKEYKKPQVHAKKTGDKIEQYFKDRHISKATYQKRKIGESESGAIMLPYFENGELVLVKYRTPEKPSKHWREEGGKPVFWGMDQCSSKDPLVIVEGEMDALALDECGIKNVVSVPSGSQDLECITNCWEWLSKFQKIIIWGDNDEAGKEMIRKLINRLGAERCYIVESKYKDANEHLIAEGKQSVIDTLDNHREVPIDHIKRLSDSKDFDPTKVKTIKTGIYGIDKTAGGLMLGHCSIVSGKNGSGKSTLLNQIVANAVDQNCKVGIYSGELDEGLLRYWIELPIAGPNHILEKDNGPDMPKSYYLSKGTKEKIRAWYKDYIFNYDNQESTKPSDILKKFEETYKRYNCKLFIIDNLMTMSFPGTQFEQLNAQSEFVGECIKFAQRYECHVIIVQHPVKTLERITKDDIKGTGDITNRVSTVFLVHRLTRKEKEEVDHDSVVEIAKNRYNGRIDVEVELTFDEKCKRFYGNSDNLNKKMGWEVEEIQGFIEVDEKAPWD